MVSHVLTYLLIVTTVSLSIVNLFKQPSGQVVGPRAFFTTYIFSKKEEAASIRLTADVIEVAIIHGETAGVRTCLISLEVEAAPT